MKLNKIIYSLRIMEKLVERGYAPLTSMPNPKFPQFQCWVFAVSDGFKKDLDEILRSEEEVHCGREK